MDRDAAAIRHPAGIYGCYQMKIFTMCYIELGQTEYSLLYLCIYSFGNIKQSISRNAMQWYNTQHSTDIATQRLKIPRTRTWILSTCADVCPNTKKNLNYIFLKSETPYWGDH